tara:strand:- start:539 stop:868 length:330 start_codon:yes stop_codon:yes gene_type:complete
MSDVLTLPVRLGVAAQRFSVVLDGRRYRIDLDWIGRTNRWSISFALDGGTVVWGSRTLATRSDLLKQHRHREDIPPGVLACIDLAGLDREPTIETLGRDDGHALIYITA